MKSRPLMIVGIAAVLVLAFFFVLPRAYSLAYSILFPQRALALQTRTRLPFLAAAASEAHRWQGA